MIEKSAYLAIRAKLDLERKPFALVWHCIRDLLFVGAIYGCWNGFHSPLKYLALPLIACFIFRNFSLMHEAVHRAASKRQFINDLVGVVSGAICLLPFEPWKRGHLEHHLWSGNIEKDPVMAIAIVFPKFSAGTRKSLSLLWNAWFPVLAIMQHIVFWFIAGKTFLKSPASGKVLLSLLAPILVWAAVIFLLPKDFVVTALAPAAFIYMIAVEIVNFPHHLQLPQYRGDVRLPVWEQYQIARSCIYPKWFARWVVLNFNYHSEHHMFPEVPWYHLEKLHAEVKPLLAEAYNTDPYLKWIRDNRPLSLDEVIKGANSDSTSRVA